MTCQFHLCYWHTNASNIVGGCICWVLWELFKHSLPMQTPGVRDEGKLLLSHPKQPQTLIHLMPQALSYSAFPLVWMIPLKNWKGILRSGCLPQILLNPFELMKFFYVKWQKYSLLPYINFSTLFSISSAVYMA